MQSPSCSTIRRTDASLDGERSSTAGDPLPGGVQAFATVLAAEIVLWLPEHRALVTADVIAATQNGDLCLMPDSWLEEGVTHELDRDALLPVLELPIDMVLVSHGEPVLEDGHAALTLDLSE